MATSIVEKPSSAEGAARRAGVTAGLVALAGGALTLNHMLPGVFYDDGLYVGIAYALSHGIGYAHPHLPGSPAAVHFPRSEEHTSELQSLAYLVCRLLLEKK